MFPESAVAAKYSSGRTKTSHIADALAENDSKRVAAIIQRQPFSVATDGSNDIGYVKLYLVCVRYFIPEPPSLTHTKFTARTIAGEAILNT